MMKCFKRKQDFMFGNVEIVEILLLVIKLHKYVQFVQNHKHILN